MNTELQVTTNSPSQTFDKSGSGNGSLQLSPIVINEDYRKKWHITLNDFVVLTRDGERINNSLYRIGGMGLPKPEKHDYFMILKYIEAYYPADIMRMSQSNDPKHLASLWCIIDKNGIEKVVFKKFQNPYLVSDACIYYIDGKYYNIETAEQYCHASRSIQSRNFLFLENDFDSDLSKRGIMKINKKTGTWELFV
jgi:hypothetical protein